jgi:hypothetical protein
MGQLLLNASETQCLCIIYCVLLIERVIVFAHLKRSDNRGVACFLRLRAAQHAQPGTPLDRHCIKGLMSITCTRLVCSEAVVLLAGLILYLSNSGRCATSKTRLAYCFMFADHWTAAKHALSSSNSGGDNLHVFSNWRQAKAHLRLGNGAPMRVLFRHSHAVEHPTRTSQTHFSASYPLRS